MKRFFVTCWMCTAATGAMAYDYDTYDVYDTYRTDPCPVCDCGRTTRDTYTGVRVYKNEHVSYAYKLDGHKTKYTDDDFGFGTTVGNRLTDNVRVEYETLYMGAQYSKNNTDFEYDIWANFLNGYLFTEFGGAVAPYVGAGIGLTGIWGEVDGHLDNAFDLSYQAMVGILFNLNPRIDVDLGFKYVNYGRVEHDPGSTRVDATQLYLGVNYKFGL
ncbi:porin family protein [bacterium]|nr:porin family protein [bacterium]